MNRCLVIFMLSMSFISLGQDRTMDGSNAAVSRLQFGIQAGNGWACVDEVHLFSLSGSLTIDYQVTDLLYLQLAPSYAWLWQWNEHYLIFPVYLRKKYGEIISLFAGPALTVNVGNAKDIGVSAGAYIHLNNRFALVLSVYALTLYENDMEQLYVPINISYRYTF